MWEAWFVLSGMCFFATARLLLKRHTFKYRKKEAVYDEPQSYSMGRAEAYSSQPVRAEYVQERPAPESIPFDSFFSEMKGAALEGNAPVQETEPSGDASAQDGEKEENKEFRNIRFFES